MTLRTRNCLAIIFLGLLFLRPVGFLIGSPLLFHLGWYYLISPLPVPFSDIGPHENYTQSRVFQMTYKSGEETSIVELKAVNDQLKGPHRHKIALMGPFIYGAILPEQIRASVYDYITCNNPDFVGDPVDHFTIMQTDKRTDAVISFYHQCE